MEERYDLLCVDAPRAEEVREGLLGVEAARGESCCAAPVVAECDGDDCCEDEYCAPGPPAG